MNIFVLHADPVKAAQHQCDAHVVKMSTESAQILSSVARGLLVDVGYKRTHEYHPCTIWAGASLSNFTWLLNHGFALCTEYTYRYSKSHDARIVLNELFAARGALAMIDPGLTPFVQAMPEKYQGPNAVKAYRAFYQGEKGFAAWKKKRPPPPWWRSA
jgi:hypothetical protein